MKLFSVECSLAERAELLEEKQSCCKENDCRHPHPCPPTTSLRGTAKGQERLHIQRGCSSKGLLQFSGLNYGQKLQTGKD